MPRETDVERCRNWNKKEDSSALPRSGTKEVFPIDVRAGRDLN